MILSLGESIKFEDTPKQQKRKEGERLRTKFNIRRQWKEKSGPFTTKGRQ